MDQTSFGFDPRPPAPDELKAAIASHGTAPLLVIQASGGTDYGDALRNVLATMEARDGTARFRLEAVVPAAGGLAGQQKAMDAATTQARQVLDDMGEAGVSPERVTLGARTDVKLLKPEIRLYQG